MRKKKLLFIDYIHSSVRDLLAYYEENLKSDFGNKLDIEIYKKPYKKNRSSIIGIIARKWYLLKQFRKADLVVGDTYTHAIFKWGKKSMYIFHGALTKRHPAKNHNALTERGGDLRKMDYVVGFAKRDQNYYMLDKDGKPNGNFELLPLGLPRNDQLFSEDYKKESRAYYDEKYNLKGKTTVLYAPTFRNYSEEIKLPFSASDFERLNEFFEKNNWVMIYRPHYIENIIPREYMKGKKNILILDSTAEEDSQKLLAATDVLMTDYSSIYVDYLILDRPICFLPFDLDLYEKEKGLVIDFENESCIPGPIINDANELLTFFEAVNSSKDSFADRRNLSKAYYFEYFDNQACKRVWDAILSGVLNLKKEK
ncbi:CDP-glycerol glycerophosphotransferase family protein [Ancylomarina sp. DW003]|nr:CDP-glycerol glycerophosphotransferase family protein [Ancylomarina sp. DW003]MDE5422986.1 CDP-glycerol glycerophosphotransferase family protein [Ancylomarina sp. DW003]